MGAQLTVRLSGNLDARLKDKAKELGLKRADVVRLVLQRFLEGEKEGEEKPYDRVRSLIGSIETGIPDLGQKHREHLIRRNGRLG
ncbi:MAG: hypothetical protein HY760_04645 [Nitrospirae bacterium]|nr:hypothetical protein [Nitrospirota bacterium]